MSFIVTQAGGLATNGEKSILEIVPRDIHERSPIFLGSPEDVEDVVSYLNKYKKQ